MLGVGSPAAGGVTSCATGDKSYAASGGGVDSRDGSLQGQLRHILGGLTSGGQHHLGVGSQGARRGLRPHSTGHGDGQLHPSRCPQEPATTRLCSAPIFRCQLALTEANPMQNACLGVQPLLGHHHVASSCHRWDRYRRRPPRCGLPAAASALHAPRLRRPRFGLMGTAYTCPFPDPWTLTAPPSVPLSRTLQPVCCLPQHTSFVFSTCKTTVFTSSTPRNQRPWVPRSLSPSPTGTHLHRRLLSKPARHRPGSSPKHSSSAALSGPFYVTGYMCIS